MNSDDAPSRDDSERALVAACRHHPPDRTAWDALYALLAPLVRERIRRGLRLFPDDHIEDAVQEVFLRLATGGIDAFRGPHLAPYVLTIADHVRISENRKLRSQRRAASRTVSLDAMQERADSESAGVTPLDRLAAQVWTGAQELETVTVLEHPDQAMEASERRRRLHAVACRLTDPLDRQIIELYYGEQGKTDREIAETHRIPHATVTWRRLRALRVLRMYLTEQAPLAEQAPLGDQERGTPSSSRETPARIDGRKEPAAGEFAHHPRAEGRTRSAGESARRAKNAAPKRVSRERRTPASGKGAVVPANNVRKHETDR
jgi:RNA polymerase sigma factor (sigma-70 family)